jgi:hypothetical protein
MGIPRVVTNRNLPCRKMVRTRANEAASSSTARQGLRQAPLQEAQDPESEPEVEMEDVGSDDTVGDKPVPGTPIREASTAIDEEDADLVYDHTRFRRDKVRQRYFRYYHRCRIIVERGATIEEFYGRAPRIRAVLDEHPPETR